MRNTVPTAVALCILIAGGTRRALAAPDCRAVREVQVTWPETYSGRTSERHFVRAVIQGALREAVQEGVGLEIRNFTSMHSVITAKNYMDKVEEIAFERLQGFILSYNIFKRGWSSVSNGGRRFSVTLRARVCVPYESSLPEIVALQTFHWESGQSDPEATEVAASVFPISDQLVLSSKDSGHSYYDVVITGRILGPKIYRQDQSAEIATISHYLGSHTMIGVPEIINKMELTLDVEADFVADQTKVSEVVRETLPLSVTSSMGTTVRELVNEAVKRAIPALAQKIVAQKKYLIVNGSSSDCPRSICMPK